MPGLAEQWPRKLVRGDHRGWLFNVVAVRVPGNPCVHPSIQPYDRRDADAGQFLRTVILLALLAATAGLVGCVEATGSDERADPYDDDAELRDDLLVAEPDTTQPGGRIELSSPRRPTVGWVRP